MELLSDASLADIAKNSSVAVWGRDARNEIDRRRRVMDARVELSRRRREMDEDLRRTEGEFQEAQRLYPNSDEEHEWECTACHDLVGTGPDQPKFCPKCVERRERRLRITESASEEDEEEAVLRSTLSDEDELKEFVGGNEVTQDLYTESEDSAKFTSDEEEEEGGSPRAVPKVDLTVKDGRPRTVPKVGLTCAGSVAAHKKHLREERGRSKGKGRAAGRSRSPSPVPPPVTRTGAVLHKSWKKNNKTRVEGNYPEFKEWFKQFEYGGWFFKRCVEEAAKGEPLFKHNFPQNPAGLRTGWEVVAEKKLGVIYGKDDVYTGFNYSKKEAGWTVTINWEKEA